MKEVINYISNNFDYVVIDGEAGIEQVNRRVMEKVSHLVLVSDASKKGLQVVKTIHNVAKELVMFEKSGLIINRMVDISYLNSLDIGELELLSCIEDDKKMSMSDMMGKNIFELDKDSPILNKTKAALERIGIL